VAQFVRVKAGNLQRFGCSCQCRALECLRPHDGPTLASEEQFTSQKGFTGKFALAAWNHWDAVPEYAALMKSDVRQQGESRFAIEVYLRQSRGAGDTLRREVPASGLFGRPLARPSTTSSAAR
jgi:hypothetical protein